MDQGGLAVGTLGDGAGHVPAGLVIGPPGPFAPLIDQGLGLGPVPEPREPAVTVKRPIVAHVVAGDQGPAGE